jgi:hypothetical protein
MISAQLADGKPLPDWAHFDTASGKLTGRVPPSIVAISTASNDNTVQAQPSVDTTGMLAVDFVARNTKGQIAVMTFKIDLAPEAALKVRSAQGHPREIAPPAADPDLGASRVLEDQRHSSLAIPEGNIVWLPERTTWEHAPSSHAPLASNNAHLGLWDDRSAPTGRASLSDQLRTLGWRGAAGERSELLKSLREGAAGWW